MNHPKSMFQLSGVHYNVVPDMIGGVPVRRALYKQYARMDVVTSKIPRNKLSHPEALASNSRKSKISKP